MGAHRALLLTAVAALGVGLGVAGTGGRPAAAASADERPGCQTVHLGPVIGDGEAASSYFRLRLAAGTVERRAVVVANPQPYECPVTLLPAVGETALNSGYTYPVVEGGACVAASCWLSGLPVTVVVAPNQRLEVPFTITVPPDATAGQYLAGVVGQSAQPPPAPHAAASAPDRGSLGATVVTRVAIGVAIEVPGELRPHITIEDVRIDPASTPEKPVMEIVEADLGTTWERPAGQATIRDGDRIHTFDVVSSTILPGDRATLSVSLSGVRGGVHPADVELWYADRTKVARWSGELRFAEPAPAAAVGGSGSDAAAGTSGGVADASPPWGVSALAQGLAVLVALTLLVLFVLDRRRDRDDTDDSEPAATP